MIDDAPVVKKQPVLETVDERQGMFECATDGEVDEATAPKAQRLEFDVEKLLKRLEEWFTTNIRALDLAKIQTTDDAKIVKHRDTIRETWPRVMALCEQVQAAGRRSGLGLS